jgi:cellulose synthase/poly-beta-1,6-N-acetylglucosamine synthase-like glycosyltransferase
MACRADAVSLSGFPSTARRWRTADLERQPSLQTAGRTWRVVVVVKAAPLTLSPRDHSATLTRWARWAASVSARA